MGSRRLVAALALALCLATAVLAIVAAVSNFPRGLIVLGCIAVALVAGYQGVLHRGAVRVIALAIAVAGLAAALVLLVDRDAPVTVALVVLAVASVAAARASFGGHASLPSAPAPSRAVMFYNPRSGGGKAERFRLADEARRRGIEPIELTFERPLESLVKEALERGADGLAMAGGDGSQAVVAAAAARAGLPYACIPSGTRNHFALDLGVDRDDVVGALDAFVDGVERRVDLAEVNGKVFVNNVSLGVYAEAVQSAGYRDAKLRTLLETASDVAGPADQTPALRWVGSEGASHEGGLAVLISNNPYRLGRMIAAGTRPRMDTGSLGVAVIAPTGGAGAGLMKMWSERSVEVEAEGSVPAGIDGEAAMLESPVRFESRPQALQVRIARAHPGQSPSADLPPHAQGVLAALFRIALGSPGPGSSDDRDDRSRRD